jgi:hypothetical protein
MLSIVYLSSESYPYTEGDLATSLMNWRANNRRLEITGVLLYREGQILQLLEGTDDAVRIKYAAIERDPRHKQVNKLCEEMITERQFPNWSMAYSPVVDTLAPSFAGYNDFFSVSAGIPKTAMKARRLLEWFRDSERFSEAF